MPVWRLQAEIAADSTLPRDRITINPHFNDEDITTSPQSLCDDLAAALDTYLQIDTEVRVRAYDAQGTPPVFPQGEAIVKSGIAATLLVPRELAVCLSFYAERNLPRQRGRLYVPYGFLGFGGVSLRPSNLVRDKVGALAPILADLGGTEVDWCVYSRADNIARSVTNWWVDDEWDTVRSRGLRPTTRLEGTTTEA